MSLFVSVATSYVAPVGNTYVANVLADSPLWFAKLDETSGTTMADSSGNGHSGTYINSPTLGVPGLVGDGGTAITLNGTTQYAEVPNGSWINGITEVTLEAVVNTTTASLGHVLTRGQASSPYRLGVDGGTGGVAFASARGLSITESFIRGTTPCNDGVRHHIAMTWDRVTLKLYVDGALDASVAKSDSGLLAVSVALRLGQRQTDLFYGGTVDMPALYGAALSATRIAAHAAAM